MRPRTLAGVAAAVGGSLGDGSNGSAMVEGVAIDSRRTGPGVLFVALAGGQADGHAFVGDALRRGAVGAVVRAGSPAALPGPGTVEVEDPAQALLDLAAEERRGLPATVVGITGSTGKTCTKDFAAAALAAGLRVVASPASFNNEVGLPLTLLAAMADTEVLVCEMGSRGPGHIRLLCDVARPDVGVVTNVGVAHMELFGSADVLRDAKAELPESLPPGGTAVLNGDDPIVRGYRDRTAAETILLFGMGPDADVRATDVEVSRSTGRARFVLRVPDGTATVNLAVPGEHLVLDALAAAAVGWRLGIPVARIGEALATAAVSAGRMQVRETADGVRIVDDTYNANPASVAAALRSARWMAGQGRCIVVLGHMAELGPIAETEHERIGELVARLGVDRLIVVGPEAARIAVGAEREGVEPDRIERVEGPDEAARMVRHVVRRGDLVLVKASRVARLDRVVDALLEGEDGGAARSWSPPATATGP